jgi:uncharacterized DUF497 family protein
MYVTSDERRYVALGSTSEGRRLFIAFTIRRNRVRSDLRAPDEPKGTGDP